MLFIIDSEIGRMIAFAASTIGLVISRDTCPASSRSGCD